MATIGLIIVGLYILYPEVEGLAFGLESKTVEIPVLVIVGIILPVILIISDNYYYCSDSMQVPVRSSTGINRGDMPELHEL